jgi:hypothetical protein
VIFIGYAALGLMKNVYTQIEGLVDVVGAVVSV